VIVGRPPRAVSGEGLVLAPSGGRINLRFGSKPVERLKRNERQFSAPIGSAGFDIPPGRSWRIGKSSRASRVFSPFSAAIPGACSGSCSSATASWVEGERSTYCVMDASMQ
jgi:hypothetical protein